MSEFTTKNPTLETENNSVGSVDNSTKQTEEIQSTQAVWHNFSSNEQSNAIICKPHNGELIPNGLTDLDGKPLYSRGPYDYRFGIYTVYDGDGKAMDPRKVWDIEKWKDKVIPNVVIRYDMPVPDGNGNPIVDDQGRPCVFYAFDKNAMPV